MDERLPESRTFAEFTSRISKIFSCFVDQVGDLPSLAEILEVFGLAAPTDIGIPVKFKVKLKGRRYEEGSGSRVGELNDSVFVLAAETLAILLQRKNGKGLAASPNDLASELTSALKASNAVFSDVRAEEIVQISVVASKRTVKSKVGDVVAIPVSSGRYRIAVVVARNRFGTALGILRGVFAVPRLEVTRSGVTRGPIYTDDRMIAAGVWRLIGHDEGLLDLFPRAPEIYHAPDVWPDYDFGEFGAAETADGDIRTIGAEEANAVGLRDGTYRQVYMSDELESFLNDGLTEID